MNTRCNRREVLVRVALLLLLTQPLRLAAQQLHGEEHNGVTYIPSLSEVLQPNALAGELPDGAASHTFDGFARLTDDEETPHDLVDDAGRRIGVYRILLENDRVTLGVIPRAESVPFAVVPADTDGPETLWRAELAYGNLYLRYPSGRYVMDIGYLYDVFVETALSTADGPNRSADSPATTPRLFLPAAATAAFEHTLFDAAVIAVKTRLLLSFERPDAEPADATLYLELTENGPVARAFLLNELRYPDGFRYVATHHYLNERGERVRAAADGPVVYISEQALRSFPAGGRATSYRIEERNYYRTDSGFRRADATRTLWEDVLPRILEVASSSTALRVEPDEGSRRVASVEYGTQLRIVEPDRTTSRRGSDGGIWFRAETASGTSGWVWSEDLQTPQE